MQFLTTKPNLNRLFCAQHFMAAFNIERERFKMMLRLYFIELKKLC